METEAVSFIKYLFGAGGVAGGMLLQQIWIWYSTKAEREGRTRMYGKLDALETEMGKTQTEIGELKGMLLAMTRDA